MSEPTQKPGKSKQDYGTPRPFLDAVERRFGKIQFDLAAHAGNAVAGRAFFSPEDDSFKQRWNSIPGLLWLNPPFADIGPWAKKCGEEAARGAKVALLTPASIGSVWFRSFVHGNAYVFGIGPRLVFKGETAPYPKDLMLSIFTPEGYSGMEPWNWLDWARPGNG